MDEEAADRELVDSVDAALEAGAKTAGTRLDYTACPACCFGPFPITGLDAYRLARGLTLLASGDPDRARAIRSRAEVAAGRMTADFPGDATSGTLGQDDQAEGRFYEAHSGLPCPVLDPQSGRCDLYQWRPLICRTFGPPARIDGPDLPSCSHSFKADCPETVEACRVALIRCDGR